MFFVSTEEARQAGFRPCKRCSGPLSVTVVHEHMVETMKEMIGREYASSLNTTIIASKMHYHPSYVHRVFKKQTTYTVHEYIKKIRIEKAKHLLRSSYWTRLEIAYHVGFKHPSQLYEAFQDFKHCTLTEFVRNRVR